jgi:hypothetical protein
MIDLIDIAPAFSFVINKGLTPSTATYDPQAFGNARLVMTGTPFSLQFERDRGQVFVDIGNDAVGWHKLEYALEFVDSSITQKQLGAPPDIADLANLLQGRWDKVAHLFNDHQKMSELQAFAKKKTMSFMSGIFGNP